MKKFNVTGICVPEKNYMVDISDKTGKIIQMVEDGKYFTINRARQYGKTTTLAALYHELKDRYTVLFLSFEGVSDESFSDSASFVNMFLEKIRLELEFSKGAEQPTGFQTGQNDIADLGKEDAFEYLSKKITSLCKNSEKEVILMIDEVDKSSDNQVFLNFLGMLRTKFLFHQTGRDITFKSVILASVHDIKNLKLKIRPEDERIYNSPWNIAADFTIDMSLSMAGIQGMLED